MNETSGSVEEKRKEKGVGTGGDALNCVLLVAELCAFSGVPLKDRHSRRPLTSYFLFKFSIQQRHFQPANLNR